MSEVSSPLVSAPKPASGPKAAARLAWRAELLAELRAIAKQHAGNQEQIRAGVLQAMRQSLSQGRDEARAQLEAKKFKGAKCAEFLSALQDDLLCTLAEFVETDILYLSNPTDAEKVTMVAVGGYGRGRLAPGSDVDLLFLLPYKRTAASESFVEYVLYMLWDMGLKVGHATRSISDCVAQAQKDMTIRTSMLESRFLWGAPSLYADFRDAFAQKIMRGTARDFVTAKLEERDARHERAGRSRYLVEPNLKESKGGLRDLNTLFWIARYSYQVEELDALVELKVLTADELKLFRKCDAFLWQVRCHLHFNTGRAEERLSFDVQKSLAEFFYPMKQAKEGAAGMKPVEKFMRRYFLVAKSIGDLTAIFCASLEESQNKPKALQRLPALFRRQKQVSGFIIDTSRLKMARADCFEQDPVNLIRVFYLADRYGLDIHPDTLRVITQSTGLVTTALRSDVEANRLFLNILTSKKDPERSLRRMNEAGVLGRFVPDFGRIVALMQFNMYHHYTADEHLLRAIGLLREIESGAQAEAHPETHRLLRDGRINRRVIYLSTLLHDIAKGRPEDHSVAGARIARKLGPQLGFTKAETALTEWLVREHLVMSDVAQRRDLSDPRTIADFAQAVQTTERLEHLYVLTEVDIKAVGPGTFTAWKSQLLRELYQETEATFNSVAAFVARDERVEGAQNAFVQGLRLDWSKAKINQYLKRQSDTYWLNFSQEAQWRHAAMMEDMEAQAEAANLALDISADTLRDCSEVTVICQDHAGLFARLSGACAVAGLSIYDARITTTNDGMAIDTLHVGHSENPGPLNAAQGARVREIIANVMSGELRVPERLERVPTGKQIEAFDITPQVRLDNNLSDEASVIEVSGLDRPGLLYALVRELFNLNVSVLAARAATFGERAVDVFYVSNLTGGKITRNERQKQVTEALLGVIENPVEASRPRNKKKSKAA
jgi:[protein-PII] uridylyltransferase